MRLNSMCIRCLVDKQEARQVLDQADVMLAKGQANFETLHGCGRNIYYSFLCKCDWFWGGLA